jgi:hypothetical protein
MQNPIELHSRPNVSTLQSIYCLHQEWSEVATWLLTNQWDDVIYEQGGYILVANAPLFLFKAVITHIFGHVSGQSLCPWALLVVITPAFSHAITCLVSHTFATRTYPSCWQMTPSLRLQVTPDVKTFGRECNWTLHSFIKTSENMTVKNSF